MSVRVASLPPLCLLLAIRWRRWYRLAADLSVFPIVVCRAEREGLGGLSSGTRKLTLGVGRDRSADGNGRRVTKTFPTYVEFLGDMSEEQATFFKKMSSQFFLLLR